MESNYLTSEYLLNLDRNVMDSPYQNLAPFLANLDLSNRQNKELLYLIHLGDRVFRAKQKLNGVDYTYPAEYDENYIDIAKYNLHIKDKFKNYAELCRKLNQPHNLKGKQRKLQEKNFQRFFTWKKTGNCNEIIINQIFATPKQKPLKNRKKAIYIKHIEYLLLKYLYSVEDNSDRLSIIQLILLLGLANNNIKKMTLSKYRVLEDKEDSKNTLSRTEVEFMQDVYNLAYSIINRAIKSLMDRKLVTCEKLTMINNEPATLKELDMIRNVELQLLKEFGVTKIQHIHMKPDLQVRFYSKRKKILLEKYGWESVYISYNIKSNHSDILYGINQLSEEIKKDLNRRFVNKIQEKVNKKKENLEKEINCINEAYEIDEQNIDFYNLIGYEDIQSNIEHIKEYEQLINKMLMI